jgi:heme-degrading monooxygenase HmoA
MSVLIVMKMNLDPSKLEQLAGENAGTMRGIADDAESHGCTWHRFYGRDGEVMVVDVWESEQAFQDFFSSNAEIPGMMQKAGITAAPEPQAWRELQTNDEIGD